MSAADFSVIIPTYRRNQSLVEAIASVQAQGMANVEIFVVDDSPEGGAEMVVSELNDPRIRYLKTETPTGGRPGVVRNQAWPLASGRFLHFLDDDDIVENGYYAEVAAAFARSANIGMVFGRITPFGSCPDAQLEHEKLFFARATRAASWCSRLGNRWPLVAPMLFGLPLLVCSAAVTRRECVFGVGGFDPGIRLMEDADFNARVIRKYGGRFLDRAAIRYRIGYPSLMHAPDPSATQRQQLREGRRIMRTKYRAEYGIFEFGRLALFARLARWAGLLQIIGLVVSR